MAKKHLEYKDTRDVLPDLVPIYSSLDELVDYMPMAKAKAHLAAAKVDLADARSYIDAAAKRVNADLRPQLDKVSKMVAGLDRSLNEGYSAKAGVQAFNQAESQLTSLIRQL